jgi:plastocyanin
MRAVVRHGGWLALAGLTLAVVVAGCGGEGPRREEGQATAPRPGDTIRVELSDMKIEPAEVTVAKPGEIEFRVRNAGKKLHALRIEGPPPVILVETEDLRRGESDTISANLSRPGKYAWFCPYHRKEGMKGTITVPTP